MKLSSGQEEAVQLLKGNPKVENISIREQNISIGFSGNEEEEADLLQQLIANRIKVISFSREEGNLETVFMQIIGDGKE
jgi:ABC-2 type transport system ATP-binding protein